MTEYLEQANESLVTIVQIETKEALDNVSNCHSRMVASSDCGLLGRCHRSSSGDRLPIRRSFRSG